MSGHAVGRAGINILFPEHNSATIRNTLMVHGRIIEQVNEKFASKNEGFVFMPPNFGEVEGHIGLGLSVHLSVTLSS